eukprot:TRINITY_DN7633_c0_g1_i1.p1 TRINITY_DN7633_c0_g1~~TRINITY_DN7633_c0_g1_i1.p1  ORF type:complete len:310 (-),score=113.43 TRINITY_DN7633_c0_g1_i1:196-1053(-)
MDAKQLQALKERASNESERASIVAEGLIPALAKILNEVDEQAILALEVIFYLTLEPSLRSRIVAESSIVPSVKKMMARGRLKQRKVALATYKNLQGAVSSAREDIASPLGEVNMNKSVSSIFGKSKGDVVPEKKSVFGTPAARSSVLGTQSFTQTKTPTTITMFVEGMGTAQKRSQVEACLLKKEGIISFYSDIGEEKVVIRTTCQFNEIQSHVWNETKMRGTASKGDYGDFSQPGYLDEKVEGANGGWLNGFSSLLQIIAVKDGNDQTKTAPAQQKNGTWSSWW